MFKMLTLRNTWLFPYFAQYISTPPPDWLKLFDTECYYFDNNLNFPFQNNQENPVF